MRKVVKSAPNRKNRKASERGRQFPSISAAAAALGVSESLLKQAKRMGCTAFPARGSVHEAPLVKFIAEHEKELTTGGVALRDQKLAEEIRKLRIKNDKDENLSITRSAIAGAFAQYATAVRNLLRRKLEEEYPAAVAGLDVPQARVYGKRLNDSICAEIQKLGRFLEI